MAKADVDGIPLSPSALSRVEDRDQLQLKAEAPTSHLTPGKHYLARVELKDGRLLKAPVTVEPPRPQAVLLNKGVQD